MSPLRLRLPRGFGYRWHDRTTQRIAQALPRSVAYWAAIRVLSHATVGRWSDQVVPELLAVDALKRWEQR